jgi:hypothetical protein
MSTSAEQPADKPGKIRTWWHPLLAGFLRWQLASHYEVREEVPVGIKPMQIDFLLLLKEQGELSEYAQKVLAGLVEYLNDFTLVEFKSPSDTLREGDFQTLLGYLWLYRAQNQALLDPRRLTVIVIAPRLSKPYEEEMKVLGCSAQEEQPGIWRLKGGALGGHSAWLLETEVLAGRDHPVLTLLSPPFLQHGVEIYEELHRAGYTNLVVYMAQQIQQFRRKGKEFAMQHLGSEDEMAQALRDLLASLPPEELLAGLERSRALRDLVASLPPEERLEGLTPEQRLEGLAPAELERLKVLLLRQTKDDDTARPG